MNALLRRTISYHDYREDFYHQLSFAGIFTGAGYLAVDSNKNIWPMKNESKNEKEQPTQKSEFSFPPLAEMASEVKNVTQQVTFQGTSDLLGHRKLSDIHEYVGVTPDFLDVLEEGFKEFFEKEVSNNPLKAEYFQEV